ncbi:hypothetical protein SUDANB146_03356 [Streptomyces sp. enrichment culture]
MLRMPTAGQAPPGTPLPTALRCGPAPFSPEGAEARTCVAVQGEDVRARVYHHDTTGVPLDAAPSLLGPEGHGVRSRCTADAGDGPPLCETPRGHLKGEPVCCTVVAEFAARTDGAGDGRLLWAGSNSPSAKGR